MRCSRGPGERKCAVGTELPPRTSSSWRGSTSRSRTTRRRRRRVGRRSCPRRSWSVFEGNESDRTIAALRPRIAVVTNVDLDHHATFGSRAEVAELFESWLANVPEVVNGEELPPYDGPLAIAGRHNRRNAASALAALELAGMDRDEAVGVLAEFRGAARRLEHRGRVRDAEVYDDYPHHPA